MRWPAKQTTYRGLKIHYTVDGGGPPLMLVAGTLLAIQDRRYFGYVEALAKPWRVINVDPLGHGNSDTRHDPDAYEAAGPTNDLVAVLDAEGVDKATVCDAGSENWVLPQSALTSPCSEPPLTSFPSRLTSALSSRQPRPSSLRSVRVCAETPTTAERFEASRSTISGHFVSLSASNRTLSRERRR
jgi:hypothetical protein